MYKVLQIIKYEVTRDIIMESIKSGLLGDIDPSGESFDVIGEEHIGKMNLFKLSNAYGDYFYFPASSSMKIGCSTKVHVERYDLLAVDGVIHDLTI